MTFKTFWGAEAIKLYIWILYVNHIQLDFQIVMHCALLPNYVHFFLSPVTYYYGSCFLNVHYLFAYGR